VKESLQAQRLRGLNGVSYRPDQDKEKVEETYGFVLWWATWS